MASVLSAGTTSNTALNLSADTTGILQLASNGSTTALTIDTSQNVGIGVTPSAWRSTNKALQIGQSAAIFGYTASNIVGLSANSYIDSAGNEKYITNGTGGSYFIGPSSGEHRWSIFPNNTSGPDAALTPTEVMRITSAGNVGIGTSSPATKLQISESGAGPTVTLNRLGDTSGNAVIRSTGSTGTINASITLGGGSDNLMTFATGSTASERMRITSGGDVGIGLTSPAQKLDVSGSMRLTYAGGSNYVEFQSAANYVGRNGTSGDIDFCATGGVNINFIISTATWARLTANGEFITGGTTDQGAYNLQCNGTGVWGAGAYVNGSDARIKDDIAPLDSGLDVVAKLNPVTYKYKEDWSKDQSTQTGFIAQELLTALDGKNYVDGVVQQGGEYMSVAYQNIIPILTKAIQELKAELDATKAEVAALKGVN